MVGSGGGCTQAGLRICVPTGLGGFVEQYVPMPPTPGARTLTIENGIIFWGQTQEEQMLAMLQQILTTGMQSVMRTKARPRKGK